MELNYSHNMEIDENDEGPIIKDTFIGASDNPFNRHRIEKGLSRPEEEMDLSPPSTFEKGLSQPEEEMDSSPPSTFLKSTFDSIFENKYEIDENDEGPIINHTFIGASDNPFNRHRIEKGLSQPEEEMDSSPPSTFLKSTSDSIFENICEDAVLGIEDEPVNEKGLSEHEEQTDFSLASSPLSIEYPQNPFPLGDIVNGDELGIEDEPVSEKGLSEHEEQTDFSLPSSPLSIENPQNPFPLGEIVTDDEPLELSMSGVSENSYSPSPSPPTIQSKLAGNVPALAASNGAGASTKTKGKATAPTIILNKVLQQQGVAAKAGSSFPGIFLIDSRPYQLIPNQVQNQNYSAKELQGLQFRILSTIQQQQQQKGNLQSPSSLPSLAVPQQQVLQQPNQSPHHEASNVSRSEPKLVTVLNESEKNDTQESVDAETPGEEDLTMESEPDYESDSVQNKDQDTQDISGGSQDPISNSNDQDVLIPNLFNETGVYDFKILLDSKEDTLKTPTWLVSSITKKLYTNMNKPIPFRVILNKHYPRKRFSLRALAVFKYPMSQRQNVVRCPNHLNPMDSTNIDFPHINHVIRADHPRATYESTSSGRLSVVVPLDFPESRNEAIPILFKFMCHNSCVGGIHRRPMVVLLTLELNEKEVGRFAIDVRVCACPSRDVKTEEKHHISRGLFKNAGHVFESRRNRKRPRNDDATSNDDDDEIFYLPVRGLSLYNFLKDTKLTYLKHNPDYAKKYPDPPEYPDNPRYTDSLNQDEHSQESTEPVEETPHIDSPHLDPIETSEDNEKSQQHVSSNDKSQRVFLLYSNSGPPENPKIVKEADLPPEIRKRLENIGSGNGMPVGSIVSSVLPSKVSIKKERIELAHSEELINSPSNLVAYANSEDKLTKRKAKPQIERSKSDCVRSHLQVVPMPSKDKSSLKILLSKKKPSRKEGNSQDESSEETEKVMLAARVLASHLGSQQYEK